MLWSISHSHEFHELRVFSNFTCDHVVAVFFQFSTQIDTTSVPTNVSLRRQRQMANEKIILSKSMARSRSRRHL